MPYSFLELLIIDGKCFTNFSSTYGLSAIHIFSVESDIGCKYNLMSRCDVFIKVLFVTVVFVIVHCHNMHNTALHRAAALEALIFSSAVVQEGGQED